MFVSLEACGIWDILRFITSSWYLRSLPDPHLDGRDAQGAVRPDQGGQAPGEGPDDQDFIRTRLPGQEGEEHHAAGTSR